MKTTCYLSITILIATLQMMMMSLVSPRSTSFAPRSAAPHQGYIPQHVFSSKEQGVEGIQVKNDGNQQIYKGLSRLGSRPPNCEHKCSGCIPCNAVQAPAPNEPIGLQYSNYAPEGWRCKCGSSFFNP